MGLIAAEALVIAAAGGVPGLLLTDLFLRTTDFGGAYLPTMHFPTSGLLIGLALVLGLAVVTGAVPCYRALRLEIVEALSRRN